MKRMIRYSRTAMGARRQRKRIDIAEGWLFFVEGVQVPLAEAIYAAPLRTARPDRIGIGR